MKRYTLVQSIKICWLGTLEVGRPLFFARTDQTKPLPEPTGPTFSDPTGRPGLNNNYQTRRAKTQRLYFFQYTKRHDIIIGERHFRQVKTSKKLI